MDYEYRFVPEQRLCMVRYGGGGGLDEFIDANSEIYEATKGADRRYLFDLRGCEISADVTEARDYAAWIDALGMETTHPNAVQAILVSSPHESTIAHVVARAAGRHLQIEVCPTLARCCDFLGVELGIFRDHRDLIPQG